MKKILIVFCCSIPFLFWSQDVNPFTGSLNYNFPLVNIPSNRGAPTSIKASYRAGIQVNQPASEIGLGWNLDAGGAIYRTVNTIPDDYSEGTGFLVPRYTSTLVDVGQGALYTSYTSTVTNYDLIQTKRGLDTTQFIFPAFDSYFMTAPGFNRQLQPSYYNFYSYSSNSNSLYIIPNPSGNASLYRRPQFHMVGDFADTLTSRHYSATVTGTTAFHIPTDNIAGNGYTLSSQPFIGRHLTGTVVSNENFDITSGRLGTSNFIEYFTNAEISAASAAGFSASPGATLYALNNFIDYQSSHTRTVSPLPANGIGAFRVTGSNGLTYHYSLPVYELQNTTYMIPLTYTYSVPATVSITMFTANNTDPLTGSSFIQLKQTTANVFAIKWLLTAITGPDYVDSNNNHMIDDGDAGYWVSYDYQQWSSSFTTRSPEYGYDFTFQDDDATKELPVYFPLTDPYYKVTGLYGTVNVKQTQVYYLNKVRTSSHTAILVRDIRLDEKGGDAAVTHTNTFKPAPDLKVTRVVLFKNTEIDSILSAYPRTSFTSSLYPAFSFSAVNNSTLFFTGEWWSNAPNWKYCVLKNAEFDQDYSLCKKYYGNINTDCNNSTVLTPQSGVQTSLSISTNSVSGKLTLNRILIYDFANVKVIPSTKFDYSASTSTSNPDFNPLKTDYWGFYKSDATNNGFSTYTTKTSKNYTSAWSLFKITDPLGGITEMDYESNSYDKVLDIESTSGLRGPAFIYRIASVSENSLGTTSAFSVTLEEGYASPNQLTEFNYLTSDSIPSLKKTICIPWISAITTNSYYTSYAANPWRIFTQGDCTYTLTTGNTIAVTVPSVAGAYYRAAWTTSSTPSKKFNGANGNVINAITNSWSGTYVPQSVTYSGNGWLKLEAPVGYTAYGGGIRTKSIKQYNTNSEVYVKQYTYEDGVATNEADRFDYPRYKTGCATGTLHLAHLTAKNLTPFDMGLSIGYSKVTVKDLGQINTDNGRIETYYITDPSFSNSAFKPNFLTSSFASSSTPGGTSFVIQTINECVNKFASIFGSVSETRVFDKNSSMISRSVNQYTTTDQGGTTELFHFVDPVYTYTNGYSSATSSTVNILRQVPSVLVSSTTYGMGGIFEKTETLGRDEITGKVISMRSTGKNQSSSISYKTPAYTYYQSVIEGLDFTSARFRTILPLNKYMYNYGNIDTTLSSGAFLTAGYRLFSKNVMQRRISSNVYTTITATLPSYFNNRSFTFDAGQGSMNQYGLFNKTALSSNTMNLAASTASLYWEPTTTYNWRLLNEVTLIDSSNNIVEVRDGNNRFSASRYGYDGSFKTASASNCNYASFTFAGFETAAISPTGVASMDGDIIVNSHSLIPNTTIAPHTGLKCLQVTSVTAQYTANTAQSPGSTLDLGLMPGRIYRTSVWTHTTNSSNAAIYITLTGTVGGPSPYTLNYTNTLTVASNSVTQIGNWILIQGDFTIPDNFTNAGHGGTPFKLELASINGGTVYFDDFIFHPVESEFNANVYSLRNGRLLSTLDENGLATNYFYDAMGRITEIWKEIPSVGYKKVKNLSYNYARGAAN